MDNPFEYYIKFNRILLTCVGLWPYQKSSFILTQRVMFLVIFASGVLFQVTTLFSSGFTFDQIVKVMTYALLPVVYIVKYSAFLMASEGIKTLIEHARKDWEMLVCKKEHEIIREYASTARMQTIKLALGFYSTLGTFMTFEFIPQILDIIAPLNTSRTKQMPMSVEYFVDQEKYFNLIAMHVNFYAILGITTIVATEAILIFFVQHICGMFKICGSRAENAIGDTRLISSNTSGEIKLRNRIVDAVLIHKSAITFFGQIQSCLMGHYLPLIGLGIIILSINMFRTSQSSLSSTVDNDFQEKMAIPFVFLCNFFYMLYFCYCGQLIMDHSSEMFECVCNSKWYNAPVPLQKVMLLFIQKSMRTSSLVLGGIYVPCFEGFTTLVNMAMSYVMLLHSVV